MHYYLALALCFVGFKVIGQNPEYVTLSSGEDVVLYDDGTWTSRKDLNITKIKPSLMAKPSFKGNTLDSGKSVATVKLKKVFEERSESIYPDAWLKRNNLELDRMVYSISPNTYSTMSTNIVKHYENALITQHIVDSTYNYFIYEGKRNSGRYLLIMNKALDSVVAALDFYYYQKAPVSRRYGYKGFGSFTSQGLAWLKCINDTLYFSTHHRTYSDSSERKNAYVTCLDLKTKEVIWRSDPLVSNSSTFAIQGDHIFSGYGFTNEDDFLFGLNRFTGKVVLKHPLKKGPRYIIEKDNQLYVRTYNRNYVFNIILKD
ncbi:MAG: hypothetical protein ACI8SE_000887 [Bacteroidia bacterium]|jgi:hypothetical protein